MAKFNRAFLDDAGARLKSVSADRLPEWGSMTGPQMFAHLQMAIRYSLGKEELVPPEGSAVSRLMAKPFINGWLKFPKGLKRPKLYDASAPEATAEEVIVELEDFLNRLEGGTLDPPPHSSLGNLRVTGWCKLHTAHIDHHLRQFGA